MRTAHNLADAIDTAKAGQESMVKCPAHDDGQASLHVSPGTSQDVTMFCHAGCTTDQILAAEGLTWADISKPLEPGEATPAVDMWTPAGQASHAYPYRDERGVVLYYVMRIPQPDGRKTFRQFHIGPDGKRVWSMEGVRRVLYRLPEILAAKERGETIYLPEGEKDVDNLVARAGVEATTSPMGAGKWRPEYGEMLAGAKVVIFSDADATGRAHARTVRDNLVANGCEVSIAEAPHPYKDISAVLDDGGGIEHMVETTPAVANERISYGVDVLDVIKREVPITEFVIPDVLAKGDRLLVTGFEGTGKDVALDTPILTETGWTTMGEISIGEWVFDENGAPCRVVGKSEVFRRDGTAYRVGFSDGSMVVAGSTHEWLTYTVQERESRARQAKRGSTKRHGTDQRGKTLQPQIRTTLEIKNTLTARGGVTNHAVPVSGALIRPIRHLPIDPYTLGAWLGDGDTISGSLTLGRRDKAITKGLRSWHEVPSRDRGTSLSVRVDGLTIALRDLGVLGEKHIPRSYMEAAEHQRAALFAGLCDTDGYCGTRKGISDIELVFTDERLARDVRELALSLGIIAHMYEGDATIDGRFISRKWRVQFVSPFNPFRHAAFKSERWLPPRTARSQYRYITSVTRVEGIVETQCIEVDSPSHLYLVGETLIPTHNSQFLRQFAAQVAAGVHPFTGLDMDPKTVLYIDAENHPNQTVQSWQDLVGLAAHHQHEVTRDRLIILEEWDTEVDLIGPDGKAWMLERIHAYQPDLVCMGPLYNMVARDLKDDETVRRLKGTVNEARAICGTAFVMEHHAPHKGPMDRERSLRPYGSSILMRWPDFGYGIKPTEEEGVFEWQKIRWPRVRSRKWPEYLRWGKPNTAEWPWMVTEVDEGTGRAMY